MRKRDTNPPSNILIILANPRSGSTWLFDSIRYHPAVRMLIRGDIYNQLGLSGRRYPRDLVPKHVKGVRLEVRPDRGKWAKVPFYAIPEDRYFIPPEIMDEEYAIEKIHPHFYGFDTAAFTSNINDYKRLGKSIKILYQVRDPVASLESFFSYQNRNPKWNEDKEPAVVIDHMQMIYRNIYEVANLIEGLILDYSWFKNQFNKTLDQVFEYLWPGTKKLDIDRQRIIEQIHIETGKQTKRSNPLFFGKSVGLDSGKKMDYNHILQHHSSEIDQCKYFYRALFNKASV